MKQRPRKKRAGSRQRDTRLYTLEVSIFSGPVTEEFMDENPVVSRTIQIRGDQTLEQLHEAIFDAFDRWDDHMYEFQVGGEGPMDPAARRYVLPMAMISALDESAPAGDVTRTTIGSLGLKVDEAFGYWFDFGDDWWHQVNVLAIADKAPRGEYPKVTERIGESPPQYMDWGEEEHEEEEDEPQD
ncbi:MAG: plasmid pRiA4b ORF-3 family protein [Armatimonadota bacterium]